MKKRSDQRLKRLLAAWGDRKVAPLAATFALLFLLGWLAFFDSHSILKRVAWHQERAEVRAQNEELASQIAEIEAQLEQGLSDELVERLAREQYGMRRPGESVYPTVSSNP